MFLFDKGETTQALLEFPCCRPWLKEGDDIEIHIAGDKVFEIEKKPSAQELLARLRKYRGRLPADFKFDRLEAHENR